MDQANSSTTQSRQPNVRDDEAALTAAIVRLATGTGAMPPITP